MHKYFCTLLLFLWGLSATAQTKKIDSLRNLVYSSTSKNAKLEQLLALTEEYQSMHRDSLESYTNEISQLASKSTDTRIKTRAALALSYTYTQWGWSDSARLTVEPEIEKYSPSDPAARDLYFKLQRVKAMSYGVKSNYEKALEVLFEMLPIAEKYQDSIYIALTSNTIGSVYMAMGKMPEAVQWIVKGMEASPTNSNNLLPRASSFVNYGIALMITDKTDSAVYFTQKGLVLGRQIENLNIVATALRTLSSIYTNQKDYEKAEKALLEMIQVRSKISATSILIDDNIRIVEFYAQSGQLKKAIELCKKFLQKGSLVSNEFSGGSTFLNDPKNRVEFLKLLAGYYKEDHQLESYAATLEELNAAKDSLYEANSAEAIAQAQTQYEVQKKENTILKQKNDIQQKDILFYESIAFLVLIVAVGLILFSRFRTKQKIRQTAIREEEKTKAALAVQKAEEQERKRIAADLHDNLGAYAASMAAQIDSIHLNEVDPGIKKTVQGLHSNSQAIISQLNDTIWVLNKEALSLTAISDRIKSYINKIIDGYPAMDVDVVEEIETNILLSSSQAFNLYRLIQEGINNGLKHSKGTNLTITIKSDSNNWSATVSDNGVGFNKSAMLHKGNGLHNMKRRAEESNWEIDWKENPNGGCSVYVSGTSN